MSTRVGIWLVFFIAWTIGLLVPIYLDHEHFGRGLLIPIAAKALHLSMYAVLAYLTGWLRAPVRYRLLLLFLIMAHGSMTEFLQDWVPSRSGTTRDVCIDHIGILIGLLLGWRWWTEPDGGAVPNPGAQAAVSVNGKSARASASGLTSGIDKRGKEH